MVDVAQLVERRIVIPVVEGSIPFVHPIFQKAPDENPAPFAFGVSDSFGGWNLCREAALRGLLLFRAQDVAFCCVAHSALLDG